MSNVKVTLFASGTIGPGGTHHWFLDIKPSQYNKALRRVRHFSAVPYVPFPDNPDQPDRPLFLPPDPPYPPYEQRVEVAHVFHLLKGTPAVAPGTWPPNSPALQINVVVTNLMATAPVTYELRMMETDN